MVTLTEQPLAPSPSDFGLASVHFPISDMGIPTPRAVEELCRDLLSDGAAPVLVHCRVSDPEERRKLRDQIRDKVR